MSGINLKRSFATVGIVIGVLAAAASAGAATHESGVIGYNGHAGLGESVYQHSQTDLEFLASSRLAAGVNDGTSNTVAFGERSALMADMGGQFQ